MAENLQDLLIEELKDIYDAEQQAVEALRKMAKSASAPEVQKAFEDHAGQTRNQIQRLQQAFRALGEKPEGNPCKGMEGIIAEAEEMRLEAVNPEFKDTLLVGAEQKAEHYEMAAYQSVQEMAEMLGQKSVARLLRQNLAEEERMSRKLSQLSTRWLKKAVRAEQRAHAA